MELLETIMPPILAAIGAYGRKVLTATEDGAANATVHLGQRLLHRLRRGRAVVEPADADAGSGAGAALDEAVVDVAEHAGDADFRGALRARVRKFLEDDADLASDLAALLDAAGVRASGAGAVAVQQNSGIISTGDGATNTINRG
ncbi:hypothetical protein [Plantactinospora alkalitolerans]|nr:hypothetical protein [Plantactinospora alkalitolerans]